MPTGYTAKLCTQDVPFGEFVMTCARAMGACVMMRDEPFDAPIPESFAPSDYHPKKIAEAEVELARINELTNEDLTAASREEFKKQHAHYTKMIDSAKAARNRMNAMLAKVVQWGSPSSDHDGLKKFMLEQLRSTIDFDGDGSFYEKELLNLRQLSAIEYKHKQITKALKDIEYHHKEHVEEVTRTENRNIWIKQLRDSLTV